MKNEVFTQARVQQCQIKPCGDGTSLYRILADGADIGEIRRISLQSVGIHLGSRRLLLRDDGTAAAVARGISRWRVFLQRMFPSRTWSLYEGEQQIAQLRRCWQFRKNDYIELHAAGDSWTVVPGARLRDDIELRQGNAVVGSVRSAHWGYGGNVLQGGGMPTVLAASLLYVIPDSWFASRPVRVVTP